MDRTTAHTPKTKEHAPAPGPCALTLVKGRHTWRLTWSGGSRDAARRVVADLAQDPGSGLDAFDAALLLRGLDRFLIGEFQEFPCPEPSA